MIQTLTCRSIQPGRAQGSALVSTEVFPLSGVTFDLAAGRISWPGHPLHGQCVKDRILVLPRLTAFAGGDWALLALCAHYQSGPRAILCTELPPMLVAGAVLGKLVTVAQLPGALLESISQGDLIEVDTSASLLRISSGLDSGRPRISEYRLELVAPSVLYLSDDEVGICEGARGEALQECLGALVAYGQALNATHLIPIGSVHAAGSGYNTTGDVAIRFLHRLAEQGIKTAVPATLNPIALDLQRWDSVLRLPAELFARQRELNQAFDRLGFAGIYSCKPYWTTYAPKAGSNFVSSEHNVVSYANSVIGARTNFESNIMAILAALIGRIPYYGLYLDENRRPTLRVRVEAGMRDAVDWRCLGVAAARRAQGRIPFFTMQSGAPDRRRLRDLCAAFGPPWTSVAMLHADQVTPQSERARQAAASCEEIVIRAQDLERTREEFFLPTTEPIDLVALGCPQASIDDIGEIASKMQSRRVRAGSQMWIWTDADTRSEAEARGYAFTLERAGAEIVSDTCGCAACPVNRSSRSIRHVATDSTKSLGFLQRTGLTCHLGGLDECLEAATTGRWQRQRLSSD